MQTRRTLLGMLAATPLLGFLKPSSAEAKPNLKQGKVGQPRWRPSQAVVLKEGTLSREIHGVHQQASGAILARILEVWDPVEARGDKVRELHLNETDYYIFRDFLSPDVIDEVVGPEQNAVGRLWGATIFADPAMPPDHIRVVGVHGFNEGTFQGEDYAYFLKSERVVTSRSSARPQARAEAELSS